MEETLGKTHLGYFGGIMNERRAAAKMVLRNRRTAYMSRFYASIEGTV